MKYRPHDAAVCVYEIAETQDHAFPCDLQRPVHEGGVQHLIPVLFLIKIGGDCAGYSVQSVLSRLYSVFIRLLLIQFRKCVHDSVFCPDKSAPDPVNIAVILYAFSDTVRFQHPFELILEETDDLVRSSADASCHVAVIHVSEIKDRQQEMPVYRLILPDGIVFIRIARRFPEMRSIEHRVAGIEQVVDLFHLLSAELLLHEVVVPHESADPEIALLLLHTEFLSRILKSFRSEWI